MHVYSCVPHLHRCMATHTWIYRHAFIAHTQTQMQRRLHESTRLQHLGPFLLRIPSLKTLWLNRVNFLSESVFSCKSFCLEPCSRRESEFLVCPYSIKTSEIGKAETSWPSPSGCIWFETVSPCFKADSPVAREDPVKEATGRLSLPCPCWWDLYLKRTFLPWKSLPVCQELQLLCVQMARSHLGPLPQMGDTRRPHPEFLSLVSLFHLLHLPVTAFGKAKVRSSKWHG